MRAGRMNFLSLALLLLLAANSVSAQSTQPASGAGDVIRRADSSAGSTKTAGPSATRVALSLAAVLGLIVLLAVAGKRFLPRGALGGVRQSGGAVQVLARTAISPKQRVVLLQVGRRILVVADGGANLNTLCEITDADEAAALIAQLQSEKSSGSFGAALSSAMDKFRAAQAEPPRETQREPQPSLDSMRQEIEGLAQRVRGMAR